MKAVWGKGYYCEHCDKGYSDKAKHMCPAICPCCRKFPRCQPDRWIKCHDCNRAFMSQDCFDHHKRDYTEEGDKRLRVTPLCQNYRICATCEMRLRNNHQCGVTLCPICKSPRKKGEDHSCFIRKYKPKKKDAKRSFIFFDTETAQDKIISENELGAITEQVVNTAVSLKVCDNCIKDPEAYCEDCGTRDTKLKVFFGPDALDQLCQSLFVPENRGCVVLAHNFKGFDGQFILKWLDKKELEPKIVVRGLEILSLEQDGILFRDTLNFMPFKLAAFTKAFDLASTKGDFPHLFNEEENYNAVLPHLPDLHYYMPECRSDKDRATLEKWHTEENQKMRDDGRLWVFQDEIKYYCIQDVLVLAQASMKFRKAMLEQTNIDCFFEAFTIAGVCNLNFRANHLQPNQICLIPEGGFRRSDKQSVVAIKYLKWFTHDNDLAAQGQRIQHARNQGEFRIAGYKVDGLLRSLDTDEDLRVVYEVYGCCYHGCPQCYPERDLVGPTGKTMGDLYDRTLTRELTIENAGYEVHAIWEHEINAQLSRNKDMAAFFKTCIDVIPPLDPRDSFYGGRVCNLHMNYECKQNERICYFDVCSLYPWVNYFGRYPIGVPQVITENFLRIDEERRPYDGIILCKILPPRELFHPVLPFRREDKKLIFCLCRKCGEESNRGVCQHSVDERALTGTWVTDELYEAVEDGYQVLEIYEVYHWSEMIQYDPQTKDPSTSLFGSYIAWAIQLKVQASGYPPTITTDEQKAKFRADYLLNENIELEHDKMQHNASLRSLAKLCANSFWGKFGQRSDSSSVRYFTDPAEFYSFIYDSTITVKTIRICSESKVSVTYKKLDEFMEAKRHVSVVIAAWTTAQARLKLLSYLRPLGRRALYYDTDSVIFVVNTDRIGDPNYYIPPKGIFLGQLTDELEDYGIGSYCVELVAAGPKVYSMKIWSTKSQDYVYSLKIRGFSINSETSKKLNFHSLKALVREFLDTGASGKIDVTTRHIGREADRTVTTRLQRKSYRVVSDKINVLPTGETLPFGY